MKMVRLEGMNQGDDYQHGIESCGLQGRILGGTLSTSNEVCRQMSADPQYTDNV